MPPPTERAARRALLDALGVMLAATTLAPEAEPYRLRALAGKGTAARLLGGGRAEPSLAALANGALGHALDYGDTYDAGPAHPNAALVPTLLALADTDHAIDIGRLVRAMAAASDMACRLSLAPSCPYEQGGWYPPPLCGTIAAAAGATAMLGGDCDTVIAAMGLAMCGASFPGEIGRDAASGLRAVREGFAARAAVEAALLATTGARGFAAPLEGAGGFFALYGGGGWRDEVLLDGLGERFLGDEVSFKPWPSCRGTHPYIEAALVLRDTFDLAQVVRIEAETGPVQAMLLNPRDEKTSPATAIGAKFSIPFTVATALLDGDVTLDSFGPVERAKPGLRDIADRTVERRNPDWGRGQAASGGLRILLADGTHREHRVLQALGHPERPLSDTALVAKFVDCAGRARAPLSPGAAQVVASLVLDGDPGQSASTILDACL